MTRDDIIRMAREAGAVYMDENANEYIHLEDLPKIAALVAAAEREACAKVCDGEATVLTHLSLKFDSEAEAILAQANLADELAAAIRARGQA